MVPAEHWGVTKHNIHGRLQQHMLKDMLCDIGMYAAGSMAAGG
jgi:hypothetical protein